MEFHFFDLGVYGDNGFDLGGKDTCYDESNKVSSDACDTATVVRIYPPDWLPLTTSCRADTVIELPVEAIPAGADLEACQWLQPFTGACSSGENCCRLLDDVDFVLTFRSLVEAGFIGEECIAPGVWRVEIDTSENTIGNYPRESKIGNALHNDIDIFRFSAVQSRSDCSDPKRFIRVFTNALNFANLPGEREIRAGFFANVGGGWITSVDSSLQTIQAPGSEWVKESEPPPRPPIRGVLPPGEPLAYDFYGSPALIPFDLTYQAVEVADGSPPPTGNVETSMIRQEIKFGFLSEIFGQATGAGDPFPGYPFPVSLVDSQGLWGFELNPEVRDPEVTQIVTITVRSQTAPLNPNALANIPLVYPQTTPVDLSPNAHPVHFPFDQWHGLLRTPIAILKRA
ncbi:MAG: hypothetical protein AAFQ82_25560, partial [Myxococcota bacterium]